MMPPRVINILLVDGSKEDCHRFRLEQLPGLKCVGMCASGIEALQQIPRLQPAMVLMEILMPGMTGLECARRLKILHPQVKILIYSGVQDSGAVEAAKICGADGYILKSSSLEDLRSAFASALMGQFYVSDEIITKTLDSWSLIDPVLAFPRFLTDHAFLKWDKAKAQPGFWFMLAQQARFKVGGLVSAYGRSHSQIKLDWLQCFGMPAHQWLVRVQIAVVKHLLKRGQRTGDICAVVHVSSAANLSHKFRRCSSLTLENYRAQCIVSP